RGFAPRALQSQPLFVIWVQYTETIQKAQQGIEEYESEQPESFRAPPIAEYRVKPFALQAVYQQNRPYAQI
ncbi:MAG: hypothetical protein P8016_05680, partial [Sedimentisphaerales bacterium]